MKTATIILSVYLFLLSLAPDFGGHELLKIPAFIAHFLEHQRENKEITLVEFTCIHYMRGQDRDSDGDADMKLPFKSEEVCLPVGSIALVPFSLPEFSFKSYLSIVNKILLTDFSFISFQRLSTIWQPPKAI